MSEIPEPKSPLEYLYQREQDLTDTIYLRQPVDRVYRDYTWGKVADQARRLASAMRDLGIKPGDRVAILSKNCAEWIITDLAIMMAGCVSVPIYSTANERTIGFVLAHSECVAIVIGRLDDWDTQHTAIPESVVRIAMPYDMEQVEHRWDDLMSRYEPWPDNPVPDLDQTMTILYTSGSTGDPKGAVHSFRNFVFAGQRIGISLGTSPDDRILSYLPLAHCTERAYVEAATLVHGGVVHFVESLSTFSDDLRMTRPTFFGSVPRLWKRFQIGIYQKMPEKKLRLLLSLPIIGKSVAAKVKEGMGVDQARWFMSGSAPIAPSLLRWWERLGMPIAEGWGMTETMAYGTMLAYGDEIRVGSIGKAALDSEVRLGDDDEIQIKTGSMMQGYYKDPEKTAEAMTEDGFLRTGDRGKIDADGYISITGRVKDIYKTAKGKYVAPVPIESAIARTEIVEQACLIGSGMVQPVALIELTPEAMDQDRDAISSLLEATRVSTNETLESHARVARFIVVKDSWTVENGLLTPTLKIKRHELEARYGDLVQADYDSTVVFE